MSAPATSSKSPHLTLVRRAASPPPDDATLARAVAERDEAALAVVWDRYASLVRGILRRSLGPGFEVEDLLQETFLSFFREAPNMREPAALRSFLVGIAVRNARSAIRRRKVRRWLMLTDTGALPDAPEEDVDEDAREALARLYAILDELDEKGRMLFVLRHVEGLELTEVAAAMGASLATVKRHLAKVTTRVRAMAARDPVLLTYLVEARPDDEAPVAENSHG